MKTLAELQALRDQMKEKVVIRNDADEKRVVVGMATCGIASGARPVLNELSKMVQDKGLSDKVTVTQTGCIGLCQYEPIVEVLQPGKEKVTYIKMTADKADEVVEQHLIRGIALGKYTLANEKL